MIKATGLITEKSALYIISTPIGNLGDITLRALEILRETDFILCEDTRHSAKLLNHYSIKKPLYSYHKFNERASCASVAARLREGECAALISDAGTPLISDPGLLLVQELIREGISFYAVPGANAVLPALIMSGFDTSGFDFRGFLPKNKNERRKMLLDTASSAYPCVFYAASHELKSVLNLTAELFPDRSISVSKELTKIHEATYRGTPSEAAGMIADDRGEFVIVLDAQKTQKKELPETADLFSEFSRLTSLMSRNDALKELSVRYGISRNDLYKILLAEPKNPL